MLNVSKIRQQFPILHQEVNGYPLVYLDNGATTHKPKVVIDAIQQYYEKQNSNIHRGVHYLSQLATDEYEASRETVRKHFNADHVHEIIFTKGNTEAINLVANGFRTLLTSTDEVLKDLGINDPILEIAKGLEKEALEDQYFVERKLYPNVDFYSGIIYKALDIPNEMFTVMFALGRLPGWVAHWREMRLRKEPIGRPRQVYIGETERPFTDIKSR